MLAPMTHLPKVIQGGMGVAVSNWRLARAVSRTGQLGVVSGTALETVLVRRLQDGDPGGDVRRAMAKFPLPDIANEVLGRYFLPSGREPGRPYARLPMHTVEGSRFLRGITMLGAFTEVTLAREGHDHDVGMNLLTKVQLPNLATLYGAMLAGVDWILMGAGIPRDIPGALDAFAAQRPYAMKADVTGASRGKPEVVVTFDPGEFGGEGLGPLKRPSFLPIISSHSLATMLLKRASGSIEGFVVEAPSAGGHNAPPRGNAPLDALGQPVYGERDVADLDKLRDLGLPFWLAGGVGSPEGLQHALAAGAAGIQVGTLFAYSEESGLEPALKRQVIAQALADDIQILTDPLASPTGFPFKVVSVPGTASSQDVYEQRGRVCDLGYLREIYEKNDGSLGYRCASEPVDTYVAKGGSRDQTIGRKCLCNALTADVGMAQIQKTGQVEPALVTSGDELLNLGRFLAADATTYPARDVVAYLLGVGPARGRQVA